MILNFKKHRTHSPTPGPHIPLDEGLEHDRHTYSVLELKSKV